MDFRMLTGPIYAAACAALCVGAVTFARSEARQRWAGRPIAFAALAAIALAFVASRTGLGPAEFISSTSVVRLVAMAALVCGAVALTLAFRLRARASACLEAQPLSVDDAVLRVRAGEAAEGVFEGNVSCEEPVTSPGGIVCVAYDAELRQPSVDGSRGSLLSQERGFAHVLKVKGPRMSAQLAFNPGSLLAPTEVRRCRVSAASPFTPTEVLASGQMAAEALAWERVLRMGDSCRIVGKLEPGATQGSYRIKGLAGQPPLILVGQEVAEAGKRFFRAAMAHFAAAAVLCGVAVWLLRM